MAIGGQVPVGDRPSIEGPGSLVVGDHTEAGPPVEVDQISVPDQVAGARSDCHQTFGQETPPDPLAAEVLTDDHRPQVDMSLLLVQRDRANQSVRVLCNDEDVGSETPFTVSTQLFVERRDPGSVLFTGPSYGQTRLDQSPVTPGPDEPRLGPAGTGMNPLGSSRILPSISVSATEMMFGKRVGIQGHRIPITFSR